MKKRYGGGGALPFLITALVFAGCEYFNASITPFIAMNTAQVTLNTVSEGVLRDGTCFVEYANGTADYDIPVTFNNPQQFNIQVVITRALKDGESAAEDITVLGWTKDGAAVRISGVTGLGGVYEITLRVTSKDGVASGERVFDIPLPPIKFVAKQYIWDTVVEVNGGKAYAKLRIGRGAEYVPPKKIIMQFEYVDPDMSVQLKTRTVEYGWDNDTNALLLDGSPVTSFTLENAGDNLRCGFEFPQDFGPLPAPNFDETSILGCSFKITIEDTFGFRSEAQSRGFDRYYCEYKVAWQHKRFYGNLADAAAGVAGTGTGTENAPDTIIVLENITHSGTIPLSGGKHVKLTVPPDENREIQLASVPTGNVFDIRGGSSLTFAGNGTGVLTLDGNKDSVPLANDMSLIYVNNSVLNLRDGAALQNAKTTGYGRGIKLDGSGVFNMTGGVISGMESDNNGGAVYIYSGRFIMSGGELRDNKAQGGGAVFIPGGNDSNLFTLSGTAVIRQNEAAGQGGAVYMSGKGTFTMTGGEITGNKSKQHGGAVCLSGNGNFNMSGGVISGNEQWDAGYKGGGVYVGGSTSNFNMSVSALIEGNTAAGGGKGVYVNDGVFKMSGGARVAPDNDVFLAADKFITIDGALTKTTPVATITPQTYTEYLRVLGGNPTLVAAAVKKFALSLPYSGGWYIADGGNGTEGTIRKKVASRVVDNAPYYYETLAAAIAATPENSHTAITIYDHILITERIIIPANKQITLTVSPMIIITLNRDSAYTGAFFEVTGSASLTLSAPVAGELILDGMGGAVTARESLVYVNADGNFTLKSGAVLRNNMFDRDGVLGGGAVCNQGTFTMEGGKITGNKKSGNSVAWGGGVYSAGTFTMSGGEISNNSVSCQNDSPQGAGVHIAAGTFNMSDGIISGNNDIGSPYSCIGGGVYIGAGSFTMSGGVIYGLDANSPTLANTVSGLGGTLYLTGSSSAKYGNNTDIPNPYDDTLYGSY